MLTLSGCPSAGAAGRRGGAARRRARDGTRIWRPSSASAARLSPLRSARRRAPPARAHGVVDPRAGAQRVDARPPDRARDVHDHLGGGGAAGRRPATFSAATGARRRRPRADPQLPQPEHDREQRARDAERELAAAEIGHAATLGAIA